MTNSKRRLEEFAQYRSYREFLSKMISRAVESNEKYNHFRFYVRTLYCDLPVFETKLLEYLDSVIKKEFPQKDIEVSLESARVMCTTCIRINFLVTVN